MVRDRARSKLSGAAQIVDLYGRLPAIHVKPFVKGQKNDCNDAEAIADAA